MEKFTCFLSGIVTYLGTFIVDADEYLFRATFWSHQLNDKVY